MSSAPVAALVVVLTLSAVLLLSGVAKLRDARATRDAFIALRVPSVVPAGPSAAALPWVEIALAVLLLASPAALAWVPAAAVLLLMLAYTALIARALGFDEPVTCSCFGTLGRHDVDRLTLARNILLTVLAGLVVWFAVDGGSTPSALGSLDAGGWWALAATVAAVAVALLALAPGQAARTGTPDPDAELLDYERQPIPYGVLTHLNGNSSTLAEAASTQARLVFFLNTHCGSCLRIGEKLDGWADRLDPAVGIIAVYATESAAAEQVTHRADLATWEPELNVQRVLGLAGTPAAVLLGADGLLAGGPVRGEDEIVELVEAVLAEVEAAGEPVEQ